MTTTDILSLRLVSVCTSSVFGPFPCESPRPHPPLSRSFLATLVAGALAQAITLGDYAKANPLVIHTVRPNHEVSIGKENQVNNLKEAAKSSCSRARILQRSTASPRSA